MIMKPKRLTIARLKERTDLIAKNQKLKQQIDANERQIKLIEESAIAELETSPVSRTTGLPSFTRGKFGIEYVSIKGRVKWKDAFVNVAGPDAAAKLVAGAPLSRRLKITGG